MRNSLANASIKEVVNYDTSVAEFLSSLGAGGQHGSMGFREFLSGLDHDFLNDVGMDREQIWNYVNQLMSRVDSLKAQGNSRLSTLTIIGGRDKKGNREDVEITLRTGEIVCVVGPTGSGKSRLLADIECLAQGDTPTGRYVLTDSEKPQYRQRFNTDKKLVAQISQNMNFVVDLTVNEFVSMHARSRMAENVDGIVSRIICCANELTGEKFGPDTSVTQLSGGQSRALMIADTALLSSSPVILIDEIENAGVDRKKALELLVKKEKIVLISTHDPLLAFMGKRRLVIKNGGISDIIESSPREQYNLSVLEKLDFRLMDIRRRLRSGERIEEALTVTWD
ncbi:ABC transporter ATP-binding protein YxdL [Ruminiclostridium hungatei]|uniref:ABC transporter ATP-binding protein YxdL n=1 Tax=Ruminiclostridium hungatei TaxID=48256 RepID=A0A1V4SDV9_RUMHU|nr:ATP-binding cassette domain-containing protein [Ruminiclostridium hungatei]OPX42004.1 ABC transporter ATP-binding protein YxdL [Ruminiclostridium hungatei]